MNAAEFGFEGAITEIYRADKLWRLGQCKLAVKSLLHAKHSYATAASDLRSIGQSGWEHTNRRLHGKYEDAKEMLAEVEKRIVRGCVPDRVEELYPK